jgi:Family of unknown function (DUF5938)
VIESRRSCAVQAGVFSGAHLLLQQPPKEVGFASGCQALGHHELFGVLRSFGLATEPNLTVHH